MRLGHQFGDIIPMTDRRLALCAQHGVEQIALHTTRGVAAHHPLLDVFADDGDGGRFDPAALERLRRHVESFGLELTAVHQELGTVHADLALEREPERAQAVLDRFAHNVGAAAAAGIPGVKYNLQLIGILRTGRAAGRGGATYREFAVRDATPERLRRHSLFIDAGQALADGDGAGITPERAWRGLERFVEAVLPAAEAEGVHLAAHPQDPPLPPEGLLGVHHVVGSVAGLQRFLDLSPSRFHALNFCQGTVAEMCEDPAAEVPAAIRRFGAAGKIYMVHFRNIDGRRGDFREVAADEGSVDMLAAAQAYREVGYTGMLAPDHVPSSAEDPDDESQFSFAFGYTRALIQATAPQKEKVS